jgi:REP element-mobilizing transposase RayT
MRLIHLSVQSNHLHLIVEAADRNALGRAMRGLQIRMARGSTDCSGAWAACSRIATMLER